MPTIKVFISGADDRVLDKMQLEIADDHPYFDELLSSEQRENVVAAAVRDMIENLPVNITDL